MADEKADDCANHHLELADKGAIIDSKFKTVQYIHSYTEYNEKLWKNKRYHRRGM